MSFRSKLFLGISAVLLLVSFLTVSLFYGRAHYMQRDNLRSRLVGIASTGALMIDASKLQRIQAETDEALPQYAEIKATLRRIKQSNPDVRFIYTMRTTARPQTYAFIVDEAVDEDIDGDGQIEPRERYGRAGEEYPVPTPEMLRAFEGPIADRDLNEDKWGTWLSGYAPIFDADFRSVAILGIDMDASRVRDEERMLMVVALLTFGLAAVLSLGAGFLLAHHFTRPILQLSTGLRKVAEGDLGIRLALNRKDEIGKLGDVFNFMIENLAKARAEVDENQRTLETRIAERTEELQRTREAAFESEKLAALGTLAGGIAHEFNNILCAISGQVDLAAMLPTPERIRRAADVASTSATRTRRITDALLSFARKGALQERPTDVRGVVDTALDLFRSDFARLGIALARHYAAVEPISADPDRLLQVFVNIIANARDAMRRTGGQLTVTVRPSEKGVELTFRDTGPGIPEKVLPHLFEPFCTTKAPMGPEEVPGSGLALAAAHGIIRSHGGEILAENHVEGGAVFRIRLPGRPAVAALPEATPHLEPAARARRALLVEDEPDIRSAVRELLEYRGWEVDTAENGDVALEKVTRSAFPVYIIDIAIPGISGIELIRRIRAMKSGGAIVVISGFAPAEVASQLASHDISAFLQKPFRTEELIEKLESLACGAPPTEPSNAS